MQTKQTKKAKKCRQRQCKCCRRKFTPQPHNAFRSKGRERETPYQLYCTRKFCQKASSHRSNLRFGKKNPDYHLKKKDKARARMQKYRAALRGRKARSHHRFQVATLWVLFSAGQLRFLLRLEDKRSGVLQDFIIAQPLVVARVMVRFESLLQGFFRVSQEGWYFWHRFAGNLVRPNPKRGSERKTRCHTGTQTKEPVKSPYRRKRKVSRRKSQPQEQSQTPDSSKRSRGSTTKPSRALRKREHG